MLKEKDKTTKNIKVVCGAPTSQLARHVPNEETLQAAKDVAERRNLHRYTSYEELKKDILGE